MIWRVKLLNLGSSRVFFFFLGYKGQEVAVKLLEEIEKKKRKFCKEEAKMATANFQR